MIEVAAKLKKGSVYFAGETITYSLRFTNFSELTINSHSSGFVGVLTFLTTRCII